MITKINKYVVGVVCATLFTIHYSLFTSCSEDIDESNLYTYTGETIEYYLSNRSEQFRRSITSLDA